MRKLSKKLVAACMTAAMMLTMVPAAFAAEPTATTEGLTQVDGVYQIEDGADLVAFAALVNGGDTDANAILVNNIDLTNLTYTPIGTSYSNPYSGTFDGNDKTISNVTITGSDASDSQIWAGIFACVSGTVKDFTLDNVDINNTSTASSGTDSDQAASGTAVAALIGGTVENVDALSTCSVNGIYRTGGIVGSSKDVGAEITDCVNAAPVTGTGNYTGGIVGAAHNVWGLTWDMGTTISGCTNTAAVTGTSEVGGIAGYADRAIVEDCTNEGTVTGTGNYGTGGIVGCDIFNRYYSIFAPDLGSTIENCVNSGSVTAPRAGGILGSFVVAPGDSQPSRDTYSTINSCTNTGAISSSATNGKCGAIYGAPISYAQGDADTAVSHMKVSIENCKVGGSVRDVQLTADNYSTYIAGSSLVDAGTGNVFYSESN